jgi:hypothetical protein
VERPAPTQRAGGVSLKPRRTEQHAVLAAMRRNAGRPRWCGRVCRKRGHNAGVAPLDGRRRAAAALFEAAPEEKCKGASPRATQRVPAATPRHPPFGPLRPWRAPGPRTLSAAPSPPASPYHPPPPPLPLPPLPRAHHRGAAHCISAGQFAERPRADAQIFALRGEEGHGAGGRGRRARI